MDTLSNERADRPGVLRSFIDDPLALALLSFSLSFLCLFGAAILRGSTYTLLFAGFESAESAPPRYLIQGAALSALIGCVPLLFASRALRRMDSWNSSWIASLCKAAAGLAALDIALNIALALILATRIN